jgi:tetratricopeptide (TPR) repeat protein
VQTPDPDSTDTLEQFQDALAELLRERGSLRDISRQTQVSKTTIAQIRDRAQFPQRATVHLLVEAYDPDRKEAWLAAWHRHRPGRPTTEPDPQPPLDQLPLNLTVFCGRATSAAKLRSALLTSPDPAAPAVVVIDGMAGVGKTALAVQVAHDLADRFPGGCHFVDLRGFSRSTPPRTPYEVLGLLLRKLDSAATVPVEHARRVERYREFLAESPTLIILDNVQSAPQIEGLLVGPGPSRTVITSRRQLPSLHEASPLSLSVLDEPESLDLLRAIIPPDRRHDQEPDLRRIARFCQGLPLALRIVGAKLVRRRAWSVGHLADRLDSQRIGLAEIDDGERNLVSAFELSYADLPASGRRFFRLLGAAPGIDIDPERAAALTGGTVPEADHLLEDLLDANLVIQLTAGRYRLHDLLSVYAAGKAGEHQDEASAALNTLFAWTIRTASSRATDLQDSETLASRVEAAREWFSVERDNLVATVRAADSHTRPQVVIDLAQALDGPLFIAGQYANALSVARLCLEAAQDVSDAGGVAGARLAMARSSVKFGNYEAALAHCTSAIEAYDEISDPAGQGSALKEMGNIFWYRNRYPEALDRYRQALTLQERVGDRTGQATSLSNIGAAHWQLGEWEAALDHYRLAFSVRRSVGNRVGMAQTLNNVGLAYERMGMLTEARDALTEALDLATAIDDRAQLSATLTNLGNVCRRSGEYEAGEEYLRQSLEIAREIQSRILEIEAQNCLADLELEAERPTAARLHYEQALASSTDGVDRFEEAHAHEGLGNVAINLGDSDRAAQELGKAAELYRVLGARTDRERVEQQLRDLGF